MSRRAREALGDWLMLLAGPVLLVSLFVAWSHQLSSVVLARYAGTSALRGVPRSPNAWQVYSTADVLLAVLAGGLVAAALHGGRAARRVLAGALAVGLAFTVHAIIVPPTNGASLFHPSAHPPGYVHDPPAAGAGEAVALVALGMGAIGVALSFTVDT